MTEAAAVNEGLSDWLRSDSWQDYRQQRAIRDLEGQVAYEASSRAAASRRQSVLAKQQGSLEARLARLTRAFEAFVELSDMRERLAMFDAPQLARFRSREALLDLADGRFGGNLADFDDVPGYWLPPAVKGHVTLLQSGAARSGTLIAEAIRRDEVRSSTFGVLLLGLVDQGGRADPAWIDAAFRHLDAGTPVSRANRAVWLESVDGAYGDAGCQIAAARLHDLVAAAPSERTAEDQTAWMSALRSKFAVPETASDSIGGRELRVGRETGAALHALRAWLEDVERAPMVSGSTAEHVHIPADSVPGPAAHQGSGPAAPVRPDDPDEPDEPDDSADGAAVSTAHAVGQAAVPEERGQILQALVDEGSDEEIPWIARVRELRATIDGNDPAEHAPADLDPACHHPADYDAHAGPVWDAPVGDALELLRADALDDTHPVRRRISVTAASGAIAAAAEDLAAAVGSQPTAVPLRLRRRTINLDPSRPVGEQLGSYAAQVEAATPVDSSAGRAAMFGALGGGAVALVGLGLIAVSAALGIVVAIVGVVVLAASLLQLRRARAQRTAVLEQRRAQLATAEAEGERMLDAHRTAQPHLQQAAVAAAHDLDAIRAVTGRLGAPRG